MTSWKMWVARRKVIFLQQFLEDQVARACTCMYMCVDSAWDREGGKDGLIVGRISQFRNHRPEPCNKSLVSPRLVSTAATREDEHGRVYGTENQSSTCQVHFTFPFPPLFRIYVPSSRGEHFRFVSNLPLQIYRLDRAL